MGGMFTISKANERSKIMYEKEKKRTIECAYNAHRTVVTYKHAKSAYGNCNLYHNIRDALFMPTSRRSVNKPCTDGRVGDYIRRFSEGERPEGVTVRQVIQVRHCDARVHGRTPAAMNAVAQARVPLAPLASTPRRE